MPDEMQYVVDENDNEVGKATIDEVHKSRQLHRGSHVFIFNSKGKLLLHKRSKKWTFPNMWDSSAGGHVAYGKNYEETAHGETKEELGIETQLTEIGKIFHNRTQDACNGIVMLYLGHHDGPFNYNKDEIQEIKFFDLNDLIKIVKSKPEIFTPSFVLAFKLYLSKLAYVVDKNDNVSRHAARKECHEKKLLHRASYVMIFNSKGELLLQKRSKIMKSYPDMWTLSASGHVDYGESYEEAAFREAEEELGIKVKQPKNIGSFTKIDNICNVITNVFLCHSEGPFKINEEEVSEVKFFTVGEIQKMVKKHPQDFVISVSRGLELYDKWKKKV